MSGIPIGPVNAAAIAGTPVSPTPPTEGQLYRYTTGALTPFTLTPRFGFVTTPSAAGGDGTLVDFSGSPLQWAAGDTVDSVIDGGASVGSDYTSAFYGVVFDHSGAPALKQKRALTAPEQGNNCLVSGRAK